MKRSLPAFLFFLFCGLSAQAQISSCAQALRFARATYDQGRLHEIPDLLRNCLEGKEGAQRFTQEERVEAYKLLCLTYIYLEEPQQADQAMLNLLLTDPYFRPNKDVDPAEFIALYKTFRTDPIYRIGPILGVNATSPAVSEVNTIASGEGETSYDYKYQVAFQFGASADLPLTWIKQGDRKPLTAHAELLYQQKKYTLTETTDRGENFTNERTGTETQAWISLPVSLQYNFLRKEKLNPYFSLGASADYLLNAELILERLRTNTTSVPEKSIEIDRNKFNVSGIAGLGTKVPLGHGFVVFEVRLIYGLVNVNGEGDVFNNEFANLDYTTADNVFKLRSLSVSGAYIFNKFSPKKRHQKQ